MVGGVLDLGRLDHLQLQEIPLVAGMDLVNVVYGPSEFCQNVPDFVEDVLQVADFQLR